MRKTLSRVAAIALVASAGIIGIGGAASAVTQVVKVQPGNAAPKTNDPAGPYCVGFDSRQNERLATVYDPLNGAEIAVVGGAYVNTVHNCIGNR